MRIIIHIFTALALLTSLASCGNKKDSYSKGKNGPLQLYDNGKLIASVFKSNKKEYHIWTKEELKDSKDALTTRNRLNIGKDFAIYFYRDSTLDEGHYYASYQSLFRKNPIVCSETKLKNASEYLTDEEAIKMKEEYESKKQNEYNSIYERIVGFKDITFCKNISDLKQFLHIIEETKEAINHGKESAQRDNAKKALFTFQKHNFPLARKIYYQNAKDELWEKDIDVSMSGKNITFTGYMFVKNQVKEDTYLEIRDEVSRLRFSTVGFRAFEGDDRTYWELNPQKDSEI